MQKYKKKTFKIGNEMEASLHYFYFVPGDISLPDSLDSLLDSLVHLRLRRSPPEGDEQHHKSVEQPLSPNQHHRSAERLLSLEPGASVLPSLRSRACTDGQLHKGTFNRRRLEGARGQGFRERNLSIAMKGETCGF